MAKQNVLFICVHNSARSQMAEAWLNEICGDHFAAESAGFEPGTINPLVVDVMNEAGLDLSEKKTQAVFDVWKSARLFQYVITVCADAEAKGCPIFPGVTTRLRWPFSDPSQVTGTRQEKLQQVREIRDAIRAKVEEWCANVCVEKGEETANT
jgi:arsenate reductase (thioredoxin)